MSLLTIVSIIFCLHQIFANVSLHRNGDECVSNKLISWFGMWTELMSWFDKLISCIFIYVFIVTIIYTIYTIILCEPLYWFVEAFAMWHLYNFKKKLIKFYLMSVTFLWEQTVTESRPIVWFNYQIYKLVWVLQQKKGLSG